ncbi:MAG: nucleoside triphosphate pyrophosphohydrolase [Bullifex sp.]
MIEYTFTPASDFRSAIDNLYTIVSLLRSENGCPYDRALKPKDSLQALLDEAYEYLQAVNDRDASECREEIGDVFINACMLLRLHEEYGDFTPQDAINDVCAKLIRRHPHVFGEVKASSLEEGLSAYYDAKEKLEGKKSDPISKLEHIPSSLPPLEKSFEIQKKLAKTGFDWPDVQGVMDKVSEELDEVKDALSSGDADHVEEEIGDLFTAVVNLARFVHVSPSLALERANTKIKRRFTELFRLAGERSVTLDKDHVDEMNALWDEVKLKGM